ncbi:MAG: beta-propeller domain-containing protein, partial [Patescibacteria group bacterium]
MNEFDPKENEVIKRLRASSSGAQPSAQFSNKLKIDLINELRAQVNRPPRTNFMDFTYRKVIFWFGSAALVIVVLAFGITAFIDPTNPIYHSTVDTRVQTSPLPTFASCSDLTKTLKDNQDKSSNGIREDMAFGLGSATQKSTTTVPLAAPVAENAADYSQTNIQVAGVDEADTVKTDGTYIYDISGNTVFIAKAFPVTEAKVVGKITFNSSSTPQELFIDGPNLMVFGQRYDDTIIPQAESSGSVSGTSGSNASVGMPAPDIYPYYGSTSLMFAEIYDLTDPSNPVQKRKLEFEGTYSTSRMIGSYVYFILNTYPDYRLLEEKNPMPVPMYRDIPLSNTGSVPTAKPLIGCADVSYIEPISSSQYVSVIGLPIDDYAKEITKQVILGSSQNVYASTANLYIANTTWDAYQAGFIDKIIGRQPTEKTAIYKFNLDKEKITYQGTTEVPGTILNQFSMDEHKTNFRIATTIGHVSRNGSGTSNNVYVLDKDLKQVGALTDLAPGEKFYSTRFMGDRAYLVTFKKVDPLFTVDLSDPANPKVLGQLKIPGYSDYLHPYDDSHIIGLGKDTVESEEGNFAWYQGLKMAIFDVSDVKNPKEMFKTIIGDRGTDSPALTDHKAFLFSKEKNLLVIPVTLAELTAEQKAAVNDSSSAYGQFIYQGSYVYDITLDKGFVLKGRITHNENGEALIKSGYYYGGDVATITRNLFIDGSLYSLSQKKIDINSLTDLADQGSIELK